PKEEHKNGHNCVTIEPDTQLWHCNDCSVGGSIIDWLMIEKNIDVKQAFEELGKGDNQDKGAKSSPGESTPGYGKEVMTYDYTNENGQLLYQVVRYEPKSFRHRQPDGSSWKYSLEGITRVLYNLPRVLSS